MKKYEIFLSYCWADEKMADDIETALKKNVNIRLHRDKLDIGKWDSIKQYMQTISKMDYTILLISDSYLKSSNCMYEVLEVMRDRNFKEKIFPVVANPAIYKPIVRAEYVKYWQREYNKLNESLKGIQFQNIGKLGEDLKRAQEISSNIATFLDMVTDMNNPEIEDIPQAIENELKRCNIINGDNNIQTNNKSLFKSLGIVSDIKKYEVTDFEINSFILKSFREINQFMCSLCEELKTTYTSFNVIIDSSNSRNYFYQFYKSGKLVRSLSIFLDENFGPMSIGISTNVSSFGTSRSWNGMYVAKIVDDKLYLINQLDFVQNNNMNVENVVKDIWEKYITPYLRMI